MVEQNSQDLVWMAKSLQLASKAYLRGEVPVGAILVGPHGKLISSAYNMRESLTTPLGHAEVLVLHRASKKLHSWRLEECTLYVTLEPCIMCAGAIQQARIGRVVYGASDHKAGAVHSLYQIFSDARLNHQVKTTAGVLGLECSKIMTDFFQKRRSELKLKKSEKVYRSRASVVVFYKNQILGFQVADPSSDNRYFTLPGGKIEENETSVETAQREALEETGYKIRVLPETAIVRKYDFYWDGGIVPCQTVFYLGVLDEKWHEPIEFKEASYYREVQWISIKEVSNAFSYSKDVLWAVQKLMKIATKRQI